MRRANSISVLRRERLGAVALKKRQAAFNRGSVAVLRGSRHASLVAAVS